MWEEISDDWCDPIHSRTFRCKVPEGWLVKEITYDLGDSYLSFKDNVPVLSVSMTFFQDKYHTWKIEEISE